MITEEISLKTSEIAKLEDRLKVLQVAETAPDPSGYAVYELVEVRREYQSRERDRLDEKEAIDSILPSLKIKLEDLQNNSDDLRSQVEPSFEKLAEAALAANRLFEQANEAYEKVLSMAKTQSEIGHSTVFGVMPLSQNYDFENVIFVVSSAQISVMKEKMFRQYRSSGNISEGVRV